MPWVCLSPQGHVLPADSSHSLSISALGVLKKARAKIERHFSVEYMQVNDYAVIKTQLLRN